LGWQWTKPGKYLWHRIGVDIIHVIVIGAKVVSLDAPSKCARQTHALDGVCSLSLFTLPTLFIHSESITVQPEWTSSTSMVMLSVSSRWCLFALLAYIMFVSTHSFMPRFPRHLLPAGRTRLSAQATEGDMILRRVDKWACVKNCGACCKLGPLDSRPELDTYLSPEELAKYESMVGADDWCINFDKESRMCKIYEDRPDFCRVEPKKFQKMYDVEEEELNVSDDAEALHYTLCLWPS
jgi:Fe-S-cluster containining protein